MTVAARDGLRRRALAWDLWRWDWVRQSRHPRCSKLCLKLTSGDWILGAVSGTASWSYCENVAVDFFWQRKVSQSWQPSGSSGFGGGVGAAGDSVRLAQSCVSPLGLLLLVSEMGIIRRSAP